MAAAVSTMAATVRAPPRTNTDCHPKLWISGTAIRPPMVAMTGYPAA
ncbi:hypothetical protein [Nesterenkonia pannonica]|nr:hypothetical protein [Nesterenkonia pannonica]